MSTFKKINFRKIYEKGNFRYQLAITFESWKERDNFFESEKTMLYQFGGERKIVFKAKDNEIANEYCVTFSISSNKFQEDANAILANLSERYPQETLLKEPLTTETFDQGLFGLKQINIPKCLPFSKVHLLDITDTAFDENNKDWAFAITFQNKEERDAFVARESRINTLYSSELKARIKKDDELVAVIRYGASWSYSQDKHEMLNKNTYNALIAYFKKMYPDAYDFDKPLETIMWTFNSIEEDLATVQKIQASVAQTREKLIQQPSPEIVASTPEKTELRAEQFRAKLKEKTVASQQSQVTPPAPVEAAPVAPAPVLQEPALPNNAPAQGLSISNRLNNFLKAPSKHPITLGFIGAVVAFGAGMSAPVIGLVAGAIFVGLKVRQRLYDKALEHRPSKPNPCEPVSNAFKADWEGKKAITWTAYFKSCATVNNWRHPIIFGAAMMHKIDKEEKKAQVIQP